jgi:penicillin-binding protein 1C
MAFPLARFVRRRRWPLAATLLLAASLAWPPGPAERSGVVSLRVTDRDGGLLRELRPDGSGLPVPLDAVTPVAVRALVATEDRHFYRHFGIDPAALVRAAWSNLRHGRIVSGASTLTMQAARALRDRRKRGWWDKIAEMHLALRLELYLTKEEILTLWLNRVSFGNRTHGIEAAARLYFGKPARDLTAAEATFLIGLPQSPSRYNPFRHPERARARQRRVLAAMEAAGVLSPEERARLEATPVALVAPRRAFAAPHLVQALLRDESLTSGRTTELRTTLDPALQRTVEALARGRLQRLGALGVGNAAAVVLDNRTGAVLAYVGSVDFWDAAAGGQNDGVQMLRQPGSALKPFTYAAALASGRYTPASILPDVETPVLEAGGAFTPRNYDETFHGPVPLRQALACSYNVPAVRLAREMGPARLLETLHDAGFATLDRPAEHYGVGLTLGNGEVRLLDLARAYAALARGGSLPALRFIEWRRTASGDTLRPPPVPPTPLHLDPRVIHLVTDILSDPEARAPAFGRGGPLELPFPCAVKTGTSKDYRDNWAVGYTPRHTVAVWAGNFDGAPMRWVSGVTGAGALLKAIFLTLGSGGAFEPPPGLVEVEVCPHSGALPNGACPARRKELFLAETAPSDTCDVHRLVAIDRRTGLLADDETPPEAIETKLFTVYPPLFHPWMRENRLPFPPTATRARPASADAVLRYSDRLLIQYPENGTVFQIDPVLRDAYQRIHLRGSADEDLLDVAWWIDGARLADDYRAASWRLRPGRHTLTLRAVTPDGRLLSSRPAVITIVDAPAPDPSHAKPLPP